MSVLVECPACESRFELNKLSGAREDDCPECHFAFNAAAYVCGKDSPAVEIGRQLNGLPDIPVPRCLAKLTRHTNDLPAPPPLAPPKPKPPVVSHRPVSDVPFYQATTGGLLADDLNRYDADSHDAEMKHAAHHRESLGRLDKSAYDSAGAPTPLSVVFGILLCLISVGSLAGIIFLLSNNSVDDVTVDDRDMSAAKNSDLTDDDMDRGDQALSETGESAESDLLAQGGSVDPVRPLKTGNKVYDRIWERNAAYILQFDLPATAAQNSIMGLAIDRRGWVLTSLRELHKHPAAELSQIAALAWNQPIEFLRSPPAENLAGALPDFDLCVLQLPSAALPATEIVVDEDFVFDADVMLYAIAPAAQSVTKPFVKCRVLNRQQQSAVSPSVLAQLQERGFNVGDQFRWILHDGQLKANSYPCPLFSETGELVAIHLVYDEQSKTGYAIPARIVMDLRNGTVGDMASVADVPVVMELAAHFNGGAPITVAKIPLKSNFPTVTKGDFAVIDRAKKQFAICDGAGIDWLAKTADDYQQLQSFTHLLAAMDETAMDETIDLDRRTIFESEADTLYDKISTVEWPTMKQIEQQNRFALAALEIPGQPFFAYVEVDRPVGMVAVGAQPVAVCTIIGTEQQVILPIERSPGEVKIKSQWLVLGRDDPKQKVETPGLKKTFMSLIRARRLVAEPR